MEGPGGYGLQRWNFRDGPGGPNAGGSGRGEQGKRGKIPAGKDSSKRRADKDRLQHAVRMVAKCLDNDNGFLGDKITPSKASKVRCNARAGQIGWEVAWELAGTLAKEGPVKKGEWMKWRACIRNVQTGATLDTVEQATAAVGDVGAMGQWSEVGDAVVGGHSGEPQPVGGQHGYIAPVAPALEDLAWMNDCLDENGNLRFVENHNGVGQAPVPMNEGFVNGDVLAGYGGGLQSVGANHGFLPAPVPMDQGLMVGDGNAGYGSDLPCLGDHYGFEQTPVPMDQGLMGAVGQLGGYLGVPQVWEGFQAAQETSMLPMQEVGDGEVVLGAVDASAEVDWANVPQSVFEEILESLR